MSLCVVQSDLELGALAVAHLSQTLPVGSQIFCDRFFTTLPLIDYMLTKHKYVTATIMRNCLHEVGKKISSDKDIAKRGRG